MTSDRLGACREQLAGLDERPLDARVDALESVHAALRAELDDLLARERPGDRDR